LASGRISSRWLLIFVRREIAGSIRQYGHFSLHKHDTSAPAQHSRAWEAMGTGE
jgi:hypothetical protein